VSRGESFASPEQIQAAPPHQEGLHGSGDARHIIFRTRSEYEQPGGAHPRVIAAWQRADEALAANAMRGLVTESYIHVHLVAPAFPFARRVRMRDLAEHCANLSTSPGRSGFGPQLSQCASCRCSSRPSTRRFS
jgi:hypothetical protein